MRKYTQYEEIQDLEYNAKLQVSKTLAKRANARMRELEKQSTTKKDKSYVKAVTDIFKPSKNNRFYTGNKLSESDVDKHIQNVSNFLNSETSTISGMKKAQAILKSKNPTLEEIETLDVPMKKIVSKTLAKRANTRMKALEKSGLHSFAKEIAEHYLSVTKRKNNRFNQGVEFRNDIDLNIQLAQLTKFLNSESSTPTGIKKINERRIQKFIDKGIHIKDMKSFNDFLTTGLFKNLGKYVDSNQVLEDYSKAIDDGFTPEQIMKEYQDFLDSDMTFEQIEERRKGKKLFT